MSTPIEGEGLLNDATALTTFKSRSPRPSVEVFTRCGSGRFPACRWRWIARRCRRGNAGTTGPSTFARPTDRECGLARGSFATYVAGRELHVSDVLAVWSRLDGWSRRASSGVGQSRLQTGAVWQLWTTSLRDLCSCLSGSNSLKLRVAQ